MVDWPDQRTLGILLYPNFDLLDVCGPSHVFGMLKNVYYQELLGPEAGPVESAQGPALVADRAFADAEALDMLLVPGGIGVREQARNEELLQWLGERAPQAEIVMSVSTGAALLGLAGALEGHKATTGTRGLGWVSEQAPGVSWVAAARWVDDGNVVTAAGVGAGIDMALHVITRMTAPDVGDNVARSLEYEWHNEPERDPFARA